VRASGWLALVVGLLAAAVLPAAILVSWRTDRFSYLECGWAAIPAAVFGLAAVMLGRRGKKRERRAVLPVAGASAAHWGRRLGWLALYAVYELETYLSG
jgi:steroid 5-alpha reductase family enzyme